ncbi:hypothetical protein Rmet_6599 [Cupriavidus metallidurans CH34]|uniref:Uncharacterized protein n=1 Tax=Cupriavidus metallidurans (strain ATCC 43123 / DSM 2839 / NBRC 102507 / CH34) TaxID=266264 RepID=D3DY30_CUPMC|nr:hypothetical protein Rmet_6599 [Cupriavidus metallidurans CH34]
MMLTGGVGLSPMAWPPLCIYL